MLIEMRPLASIKPYDNNPRDNAAAIDAVAKSLREFGFRQPIVVDADGVIIVGHARYQAAIQLGLEEAPVHVALDMTADQIRAYRIADNKTAELASWDYDKLADEIMRLKDADYDVTLLGFTADAMAKIIAGVGNEGLVDPDDVPEAPDAATTQLGDLIILGNHRLLCGDSSKREDVLRLVDGAKIHLLNTDPPYNVKVEPRSNNAIAAGLSSFQGTTHHQSFDEERNHDKGKRTTKQLRPKDRPLANDFVTDEAFVALLKAWFDNASEVMIPGGGFYIWGGYANVANYPPALKGAALYFSQAVIWHKLHPVLTRKDFMGDHEWCFYGWKEGAAHRWFGPNNVPDVWAVKKVASQKMVHLTEKPTELAARAMQYSTEAGENVLDLFGGSGSTLIAAEQEGRNAFLCELDPLYCDVIVQRWENFTGQKAVRPGDVAAPTKRGKPMNQLVNVTEEWVAPPAKTARAQKKPPAKPASRGRRQKAAG